MPNLNDLPLNDERIPDVIVEEQPVLSAPSLPPQPGTYVFRLPTAQALMNCFDMDETADQGQRIRASLRDEAALYNETLEEPYSTNISNRVRYVKRNDMEQAVSDMAMLLNAVACYPEHNTNTGYAHALIAAANRRFRADHTLTANCNPQRDIYSGGAVLKGRKGCGFRYAVDGYTTGDGKVVHAIPRDEHGKVLIRFRCLNPKCDAEIRAWGQLRGFRAVD